MMKQGERKPVCHAVGLHYDDGDESPTVSFKADPSIAEDALKVARRHGVRIVENNSLAQLLRAHQVGDPIAPELYEAVALILHEIDIEEKGELDGGA